MNSGANRKEERRPALTLPQPLAPQLTGRQPVRETAARDAWSEEARELYRSSVLPGITPVQVHDVRTFYRLLVEQVKRAQQEQRPFAVVAFHCPTGGEGRRRRAVDLTLRLGVRG